MFSCASGTMRESHHAELCITIMLIGNECAAKLVTRMRQWCRGTLKSRGHEAAKRGTTGSAKGCADTVKGPRAVRASIHLFHRLVFGIVRRTFARFDLDGRCAESAVSFPCGNWPSAATVLGASPAKGRFGRQHTWRALAESDSISGATARLDEPTGRDCSKRGNGTVSDSAPLWGLFWRKGGQI